MNNSHRKPNKKELTLFVTKNSECEIFNNFYSGYDKNFVLPNEKEERSGFELALALNYEPHHRKLREQYGPYWELCLVAKHQSTDIGGANLFAAVTSNKDGKKIITCNLNYIYIDKKERNQGHLKSILTSIKDYLINLAKAEETIDAPCYIFIEQNDPFRMSSSEYERDSHISGVDQFDRLNIWAKTGARIIRFPYVQPPLSKEQNTDDTLLYSVIADDIQKLDAELLRQHLSRFFSISVLKGKAAEEQKDAKEQLGTLLTWRDSGKDIELFDASNWLENITKLSDRFSFWPIKPKSILEAIL